MEEIRVDDEIELRPHDERRAEALFRLTDENRERLRPWLPWVDETTSVADTERFIREMSRKRADGEEYGFEILHRGDLVGAIGLRVIVPIAEAEVGYWLSAGAEGQGIVSRSTRALLRFAFEDLGMHRVVIKCAAGNARSRAVPERLGFTLEATFRERDVSPTRGRQDELLFALLRSEWTR